MVAATPVAGRDDLLVVSHEARPLVELAPLDLVVRVEVDEHLVAGRGHALLGAGVVSGQHEEQAFVSGDASVVDLF